MSSKKQRIRNSTPAAATIRSILELDLDSLPVNSACLPKAVSKSAPSRVAVCKLARSTSAPPAEYQRLYGKLIEEEDSDGAAAVVLLWAISIWESGTRLSRLKEIAAAVDTLLLYRCRTSERAKAALHGVLGLIYLLGHGSAAKAGELFERGLNAAAETTSAGQRLFLASGLCYSRAHMLQFEGVESCLRDIHPLAKNNDSPLTARTLFSIMEGMYGVLSGKAAGALPNFLHAINNDDFDNLPKSIWYLGHIQLFLVADCTGNHELGDASLRRMQNAPAIERNDLSRAYLLYAQGVGALNRNTPHDALRYAMESLKCASQSEYPILELYAELLAAQASADSGNVKHSRTSLSRLIRRARSLQIKAIEACARLELAWMLFQNGKEEIARQQYDVVTKEIWPRGYSPEMINRSSGFVERLDRAISVSEYFKATDQREVRIKTFGGLEIEVNGKREIFGKWAGKRTRQLLIAIIAMGGEHISKERICDELWPDAEGDKAESSLKMTLSRLRRIIANPDGAKLPWIIMKQGKVSLNRNVCFVDSLEFESTAKQLLSGKPSAASIMSALDVFSGEFLCNDTDDPLIDARRDRLNSQYVNLVIKLIEQSLESDREYQIDRYFENVISFDPANERLYEIVIRYYNKIGYPSKSLKVFEIAQDNLEKTINISPGNKLIDLLAQIKYIKKGA